jgi:hypothetical protein
MSVIFRQLTTLSRQQPTFGACFGKAHFSNRNLKMSEMKKLLVTRMEEEIPKPAVELLQKQLTVLFQLKYKIFFHGNTKIYLLRDCCQAIKAFGLNAHDFVMPIKMFSTTVEPLKTNLSAFYIKGPFK